MYADLRHRTNHTCAFSFLLVSLALSSSFVAFLYPSKQGPAYVEGHTVILGLLIAAWFLVLANVFYVKRQNALKKSGKMDQVSQAGPLIHTQSLITA